VSQIIKKFIGNDEVGATKVRLENDSYMRARNAADSADVNLIKLSSSDILLIQSPAGIDIDSTAGDTGLSGAGQVYLVAGADLSIDAANSSELSISDVGAEFFMSVDIISFSGQNARSKTRWYNTAGTNYLEFWAPTGAFTNVTYTLPASPSVDTFLKTDASGNLSWDTPANVAPAVETFTLAAGDITNQYVTLANTPIAGSVHFMVKGAPVMLEGASYDYTVTGAQIDFENDIATGGPSALVAGDIVQVKYLY
jgi:hypothetical protein